MSRETMGIPVRNTKSASAATPQTLPSSDPITPPRLIASSSRRAQELAANNFSYVWETLFMERLGIILADRSLHSEILLLILMTTMIASQTHPVTAAIISIHGEGQEGRKMSLFSVPLSLSLCCVDYLEIKETGFPVETWMRSSILYILS
ncbi:uncharacterized protein BO97DRAFT_65896 [Aspergillus homomorphus CBS 101889]|uniref:Uncharacterized protein n=1 Tax=Aspergillus homomorphus (strain CBS 101889) TaxID=1450537 RepID=A0A395HX11_ASPHC|nr:hypothetical protein BO97DRAFT_65896 [Aspergillus homomorphus CBS 101889]RAL12330.1 hypothetical protein BO97DRAFT_65896 [Aspergillus homomorphus CBS 101889]